MPASQKMIFILVKWSVFYDSIMVKRCRCRIWWVCPAQFPKSGKRKEMMIGANAKKLQNKRSLGKVENVRKPQRIIYPRWQRGWSHQPHLWVINPIGFRYYWTPRAPQSDFFSTFVFCHSKYFLEWWLIELITKNILENLFFKNP